MARRGTAPTLKRRRKKGAKERMFDSAPKDQDLRATEKEKHLLGELWDWQERSARTPWVLGKPLGG